MLGQTFIGAAGLLKGARLLRQPGLRRFVIIPVAVNVLLFTVSLWVLAAQFSPLVDTWIGYLPAWLEWLEWLFWLFFAITALLLVFYLFAILANLIAAPFNGLLAEAVEQHLTGQPLPGGGSLLSALRETPVAVLDELRKLGYFVLRAIPLLILFWIPVVNLAAPFLWVLFSAWMMAVEYCDYPMGNHGMRFTDQRRRLRQNKLLSFGFGGATLFATMIPLVNFLVMPAAVAGATALWIDQLKQADGALQHD
ncbi:MAG: sulfate transporter CysZ [Gammaproteobacteria bacterium]|nr:sulfate transporter CysZ [Gammaproteobacteria bacterium]MCW8839939.1 sulfate transporter CysZ [Gammaproteobacteria bacterium]MCW8928504.1 sulfate transporter CysZ [Gammaproteobacteria bacterium]MCW8958970.1 sulfate transporter CysZ [Gammaproteobacteria bacterium]MCW8972716.1 sulfate transporter CysZ [Gammaproteobacteria bacterium]